MPIATARRADSADKQRGRPGKSSPFQINHNGTSEYNLTDWQAQHIATRHRVPNRLAREIARVHFGEAFDG